MAAIIDLHGCIERILQGVDSVEFAAERLSKIKQIDVSEINLKLLRCFATARVHLPTKTK
jgi:hypothetical protein